MENVKTSKIQNKMTTIADDRTLRIFLPLCLALGSITVMIILNVLWKLRSKEMDGITDEATDVEHGTPQPTNELESTDVLNTLSQSLPPYDRVNIYSISLELDLPPSYYTAVLGEIPPPYNHIHLPMDPPKYEP